ncbi:MAG: HD-GYP domain-containing protein [Ethanoligenens sp.]
MKFVQNNAFLEVTECLIAALEARDSYTQGHSLRVADMSVEIASAMGFQDENLETLHMAAHLHDIGKIGIPDAILYKPGKLLPEEWERIKQHPEIGYTILSKSKDLSAVADIVLHHHERWDGKGYPSGLSGQDIPISSRIIAVADTYDAITSNRPYRAFVTPQYALEEIRRSAGTQLDPTVVQIMMELFESHPSKLLSAS